MIATAADVADLISAYRYPVAASRVGVSSGASTTTAYVEFGLDRATFDQDAETITFDLDSGAIVSTVPARADLPATYIAQAMIDGIVPDTHEAPAAPVVPVKRHWYSR